MITFVYLHEETSLASATNLAYSWEGEQQGFVFTRAQNITHRNIDSGE